MRHLSLALLACLLTGGAVTSLAAADHGVAAAAGTITKADLEKAIAAKAVCLIDVNGSESFRQGHLPGAIDAIAHQRDFASILPASKSALIVAYCGSPTCNAYRAATDAATRLGYTNVRHYAGGLSGWVKDGGTLVQ